MNSEMNNQIVRQLKDNILVYFIKGNDFSRKSSRNFCGILPVGKRW